MNTRQYYLLGNATWFLSYGMQGVLFTWLVAMVLNESPARVGIAQMALLLPGTFLMLVGGSLADRFGGQRQAIISQVAASIAPAFLFLVLYLDLLSYTLMIVYAILMGCCQAFITPARDGLLNQVAGDGVQRLVMLAMLMQFGGQILGISLAGLAETSGPYLLLVVQSLTLLLGGYAYAKIKVRSPETRPRSSSLAKELIESILEGGRCVMQSMSMRMVIILNLSMGLFFMGSYMVTFPILIREFYSGSSADLAYMNAINSIGLVCTLFVLIRIGDLRRQGRAMLIAQGLGCVALAVPALVTGFHWLLVAIFVWGAAGGIGIGMSRTVMQEQAPEHLRSRVMAFYGLSLLGTTPLGALLCGFLVSSVGAKPALLVAGVAMLLTVLAVSFFSRLWALELNAGQGAAKV